MSTKKILAAVLSLVLLFNLVSLLKLAIGHLSEFPNRGNTGIPILVFVCCTTLSNSYINRWLDASVFRNI